MNLASIAVAETVLPAPQRASQSRVLVLGSGIERYLPQLAATRPLTTFRSGKIAALEFGDGAFDFVYSYQSLDNIASVRRALHEMRRVLRRGGSYCIGLPTNRGFSPTELRSELIAVFGEARDVSQRYYAEMHAKHPRLTRLLSVSRWPSLFSRPAWFMGHQRSE